MGFFYLARPWDRRCRIRNPAEEKDLFLFFKTSISALRSTQRHITSHSMDTRTLPWGSKETTTCM